MSRPLDDLVVAATDAPSERRLARSTARAFAAAISALLVSTLVVSRSDAALDAEGTAAGATATAGTIAISDDDEGRSLFDLRDLAPGRPFERCIEVVYEGTILPVDLTLHADAQGALAPYMGATIETGTGGSFTSCEGFQPASTVFDGTLADLAAVGSIEVSTMYNTGDRRAFRVRFEIADTNDALGTDASTNFVWEVRPS